MADMARQISSDSTISDSSMPYNSDLTMRQTPRVIPQGDSTPASTPADNQRASPPRVIPYVWDIMHDNIDTNVTPHDAYRINILNEYQRITYGWTISVVNGVIRVSVSYNNIETMPDNDLDPDQNGLATPEKALTMKIMHAFHHKKTDYLNGDDIICMNRTLLPILLDIKAGRLFLGEGPNARENLNNLFHMKEHLRLMQTQFEATARVIFQTYPVAEMERRGFPDALKNELQQLQAKQYSDLCSKAAGIFYYEESRLLVLMMYHKGWIADLNLDQVFRGLSLCSCDLFNTIEAGPEARQIHMLERQLANEKRQALLALQAPQAAQQEKHSEDVGHKVEDETA